MNGNGAPRGRRGNLEGSIRKRGNSYQGRIRVENPDGSRRQVSISAPTKKEVVARMRDVVNRAAAGYAGVDASSRFADWVDCWAEGPLRNSGLKQSTKDNYRGLVMNHAVPPLGRLPMSKVKPAVLEKTVADVTEQRSAATARRLYAALSNCLDAAERDGLIGANPMKKVSRPPDKVAQPRALTTNQIDALRATIRGHYLEPLIVCAATLGLRRGELLGLKWEDLDDGVVKVRRALVRDSSGLHLTSTKSERGMRRIPLPEATMQAFALQREAQVAAQQHAGQLWQEEGLIFTNQTGGPLEPRNVSRAYRKLALEAGLPDVGMHALRHSAATLWLSIGGASIRDVCDLLGHASLVTTQVYLAGVPEAQKGAVDAASKLWT